MQAGGPLKNATPFKRSELFESLSGQEMANLVRAAERLDLPRHHLLFAAGAPCSSIYFVEAGSVSLTRKSPDGRSLVILALFGAGDLLGDAAWGSANHDSCAETLEVSIIHQVSREAFESLTRQNPAFACRLLQMLGWHLKQAQGRIEDLVFRQVPTRIAKLFINLSDNHGIMTPNGIVIDLPLTHQEIADLVGSSRVTVTQVLNRFRSSKWLGVKSKRVTIYDLGALEQLVADEARPRRRVKNVS